MTRICKPGKKLLIRLGLVPGLIFFSITVLTSCNRDKTESVSIEWMENKATAILIPHSILPQASDDDMEKRLSITLSENHQTPILGEYKNDRESIRFIPIVPLTRGMQYDILMEGRLISSITVPASDSNNKPIITAIYPSSDTVPENLLKIYISFSKPMREGNSLQHISLLSGEGDTLRNSFLGLETELWNKEGTVLTVWLDPGRIKRELIPNRELGNPLRNGRKYLLVIDDRWSDIEGIKLQSGYQRSLWVGPRDNNIPDPAAWKLSVVRQNTKEPLLIAFEESLDRYLLEETLFITNKTGQKVRGKLVVGKGEKNCAFHPDEAWNAGTYVLEVSTYLEDLAGNNINRPFDRDLTVQKEGIEQETIKRSFDIK